MSRLFIIITILLLSACREVMVVLPEPTPIETEKVVLIEELTGVDCPNCPAGAAQLAGLIDQYEGNVIGVSIHGDFLGDPLPESQFDFGSQTADDLEDYLAPWFGKPAASINRIQIEDQAEFAISAVDLWPQFVEAELQKQQTAAIVIDHEYNPQTRALSVDVEVEPWIDIEGDIRVSVMLTESHIIDAQNDQNDVILDYEHNHLLRTMLTRFDGDGLTSQVSAFDKVSASYEYTLPEEAGLWIPENMYVVAFVSIVTPTSREILQAGEVHIVE